MTSSKILFVAIAVLAILCSAFHSPVQMIGVWQNRIGTDSNSILKENALRVLQTKCNACHRKKNPFKVFKEGNMERHAADIYEQVFELKVMPQEDVELSQAERKALLDWLTSLALPKTE